jgi:hypothetical protein
LNRSARSPKETVAWNVSSVFEWGGVGQHMRMGIRRQHMKDLSQRAQCGRSNPSGRGGKRASVVLGVPRMSGCKFKVVRCLQPCFSLRIAAQR